MLEFRKAVDQEKIFNVILSTLSISEQLAKYTLFHNKLAKIRGSLFRRVYPIGLSYFLCEKEAQESN